MKGIKEAIQKLSEGGLEQSWKEIINRTLKEIMDSTFRTHKEASQQNLVHIPSPELIPTTDKPNKIATSRNPNTYCESQPKHTTHRIKSAAFRAHADQHSPNYPPHNQKHPLFKLMANLAINTKLALFVFNVIKLQVFMIGFIGPSSFKKAMTIEMEGFPQGERPPRKRMRSMAENMKYPREDHDDRQEDIRDPLEIY
jgi:hypothetical protein